MAHLKGHQKLAIGRTMPETAPIATTTISYPKDPGKQEYIMIITETYNIIKKTDSAQR